MNAAESDKERKMEPIRASKSVRRIVALRRDEHGKVVPVTLFENRAETKRKTSKLFSPAERMARRIAEAQRTYADSYLARHEQSNAKKKDGWIKDFQYNVSKAANKGTKRLKLRRLPTW
jgi:hypothetical protein